MATTAVTAWFWVISRCHSTAPLLSSAPATTPPPLRVVWRASTTVRLSAPKVRRLNVASLRCSAGTMSGPWWLSPPEFSHTRFAKPGDVP
ncbi:hypothetical protein ACWGB8_28795 [Kitasatospora sp. NPDC054939]